MRTKTRYAMKLLEYVHEADAHLIRSGRPAPVRAYMDSNAVGVGEADDVGKFIDSSKTKVSGLIVVEHRESHPYSTGASGPRAAWSTSQTRFKEMSDCSVTMAGNQVRENCSTNKRGEQAVYSKFQSMVQDETLGPTVVQLGNAAVRVHNSRRAGMSRNPRLTRGTGVSVIMRTLHVWLRKTSKFEVYERGQLVHMKFRGVNFERTYVDDNGVERRINSTRYPNSHAMTLGYGKLTLDIVHAYLREVFMPDKAAPVCITPPPNMTRQARNSRRDVSEWDD